MTALIIGAALAVGALVYVLLPLFDAVAPAWSRRPSRSVATSESAIDALREIEFDRATGKLSDDDYSALKAEYTRSALVEMRARDSVAPDAVGLVTVPAGAMPNDPGTTAAIDPAEAVI